MKKLFCALASVGATCFLFRAKETRTIGGEKRRDRKQNRSNWSGCCSADTQKNESHDEPVTLVDKSKDPNNVVVTGDFNTQVGKLSVSKNCLDRHCALSDH